MDAAEKTFLVVNPASAGGQTGKRWLRLESQLRRTLGNVELEFTREPMDGERLARQALRSGFGCVARALPARVADPTAISTLSSMSMATRSSVARPTTSR